MPKFLYTVFAITAGLWAIVYFFGDRVAPDNLLNIFVFLILIYFALTVTFSIPLFFLFQRKAKSFTDLRKLYRESAKWGAFISFGVVGTLGLKAFDLINPLNYGLFLVLYVVGFFQVRSKE